MKTILSTIAILLVMKFAAASPCAQLGWYNTSGTSVSFADTNICTNYYYGHTIWNYGDSTANDTGRYVAHTYATYGTYYATMTVYDVNWNAVGDSTFPVTLNTQPPVRCASFTHTTNGLSANFISTSNCTGSNLTYSWNFGDGNWSTGVQVNHTYNSPGTYIVTHLIYDGSSLLDSIQDTLTITPNPPSNCASFTYSANNNVVSFTNTSTCQSAATYLWIFGDNNSGSGANPTHTYASAGTYYVVLVVLDSASQLIDSSYQSVTINMPPACQALFTYAQAYVNNQPVPGHVVVTDQSTGSNLGYYWDFGDGNNSSSQNPTHTYNGNGPYMLCLTVSNSACTSMFCDTLSVDSNGNVLRSKQGFTIHVGGYAVGINALNQDVSFNAFPNPFEDELNLTISGMEEGKAEFRILNQTGQVMSVNYLNISNSQVHHKIDVSHLEKGMYILQLNTDSGTKTTKLIKR